MNIFNILDSFRIDEQESKTDKTEETSDEDIVNKENIIESRNIKKKPYKKQNKKKNKNNYNKIVNNINNNDNNNNSSEYDDSIQLRNGKRVLKSIKNNIKNLPPKKKSKTNARRMRTKKKIIKKKTIKRKIKKRKTISDTSTMSDLDTSDIDSNEKSKSVTLDDIESHENIINIGGNDGETTPDDVKETKYFTPNPNINYKNNYYQLRYRNKQLECSNQEKQDKINDLRNEMITYIEGREKDWTELTSTQRDVKFKVMVNTLDDEEFASLAYKYGKNNGYLCNKIWSNIKESKLNEFNETNSKELNEYNNVIRYLTYKASSLLSQKKEKELGKFWKNNKTTVNTLGMYPKCIYYM